jgi:SAM-dependent methyltransferase
MGVERAVQGNVLALPFADGTFDLVMSFDMLVHMKPGEEQLAAREMARVLTRGGLLVVRAAAFDFLRSRHSEFVGEHQRYTRRQLMGLMTAAGVRVLRCTYINALLLPVALAKFRIWEPLTRQPASSGIESAPQWLDRLLYAPLAFEAEWVARGHSFPAGQSLMLIGEKML